MLDKNNIEVVVVVSGQSERLKVNVHQTLEPLVYEALQKSGNQGQAPRSGSSGRRTGSCLSGA